MMHLLRQSLQTYGAPLSTATRCFADHFMGMYLRLRQEGASVVSVLTVRGGAFRFRREHEHTLADVVFTLHTCAHNFTLLERRRAATCSPSPP